MSEQYVHENHMPAIELASKKQNFAVSFRPAGADTLAALAAGGGCKSHDVLEKTIKHASIPDTDLLRELKSHGLGGAVGHYDAENVLKGFYLTSEVAKEKLPEDLQAKLTTVNGGVIHELDTTDIKGSLRPLQTHYKTEWKAKILTGDYDMHDLISFSGSGRPHIMASDSEEERKAIDAINAAVAGVDPNRPLERTTHNVIQHGPQVNYFAHMKDKEKGHAIVPAVAKPELPVAMVHKSTWQIISTPEEHNKFYKDNGVVMKSTWSKTGLPFETGKDAQGRPSATFPRRSSNEHS